MRSWAVRRAEEFLWMARPLDRFCRFPGARRCAGPNRVTPGFRLRREWADRSDCIQLPRNPGRRQAKVERTVPAAISGCCVPRPKKSTHESGRNGMTGRAPGFPRFRPESRRPLRMDGVAPEGPADRTGADGRKGAFQRGTLLRERSFAGRATPTTSVPVRRQEICRKGSPKAAGTHLGGHGRRAANAPSRAPNAPGGSTTGSRGRVAIPGRIAIIMAGFLVAALPGCGRSGGSGGGSSGPGNVRPACDRVLTATHGCISVQEFESRRDAIAATLLADGEFRGSSSDPYLVGQPAPELINGHEARAALEVKYGSSARPGEGVTIAVMDSRVDLEHGELDDARITETFLQNLPNEERTDFQAYEYSHGTLVTSVMAAEKKTTQTFPELPGAQRSRCLPCRSATIFPTMTLGEKPLIGSRPTRPFWRAAWIS